MGVPLVLVLVLVLADWIGADGWDMASAGVDG